MYQGQGADGVSQGSAEPKAKAKWRPKARVQTTPQPDAGAGSSSGYAEPKAKAKAKPNKGGEDMFYMFKCFNGAKLETRIASKPAQWVRTLHTELTSATGTSKFVVIPESLFRRMNRERESDSEEIETFGVGFLVSVRRADGGETFQLNVRGNDEVAVVKSKIELEEGFLAEDQKLFAPNGDIMEDDCQLSHYSVVEGSGPLLYFRRLERTPANMF